MEGNETRLLSPGNPQSGLGERHAQSAVGTGQRKWLHLLTEQAAKRQVIKFGNNFIAKWHSRGALRDIIISLVRDKGKPCGQGG